MSSPAPAATGSLGTTPLSQLLIYALERSLTGSLVLQCGDSANEQRSAIRFSGGVVVKARAPSRDTALGAVCVEMGFADAKDIEETAKQARTRLFGEHLYDLGLIERDQLNAALVEQVYRQLEWISRLPPDTRYGYYDGTDFLQSWGGAGLEVDPLLGIGRVVRVAPLTLEVTERVVGSLGEVTLQLHPQARVGRFEFNGSETTVLDVLRAKPQSYAELLATELLAETELRGLIALLALTKHLQLSGGFPLGVVASQSLSPLMTRRAVAVRRTSVTPGERDRATSSIPPGGADRRLKIEAKAREIEAADFYEVLGVDPGSETAVVQAAFLQLAKEWHPDRLPLEFGELRQVVTKIFARMTEAHQTLSHPKHRAEYDKLRAGGGNTDAEQRKVQEVLRAASAFQKAEVLARRGDWKAAEPLAQQAHEGDPEQAEYAALYAWVVARGAQRLEPSQYDDLLAKLHRAVKQQRNNINVRLYRASVLKLAGNIADAMRDYRAVAELDPANVEAQRELRLHRMRRDSSPPPGALRRFFKKER